MTLKQLKKVFDKRLSVPNLRNVSTRWVRLEGDKVVLELKLATRSLWIDEDGNDMSDKREVVFSARIGSAGEAPEGLRQEV